MWIWMSSSIPMVMVLLMTNKKKLPLFLFKIFELLFFGLFCLLRADFVLTSLRSARLRRADGLLFEIQEAYRYPKGPAHWGNAACQVS